MDLFYEEKLLVPFGTRHLDAALTVPAESSDVRTAMILTHGAGGDMNFKHLVSMAHAAASKGIVCLRFTCKGLHFAYRLKAYHAVWDYVQDLKQFTLRKIFICGRSMGSRVASALARQLSDGTKDTVQGLVCLSFPLYPPGQKHTHCQRSENLRGLPVEVPVLFVSGTRDNMCERTLLEDVVEEMTAPATVYWVEGASHGLTLKGRAEESVMDEVNSRVLSWVLQHT
ncbi:testis-expressed protein 30 [Osmerus eperlanus]|uniref:testis-expressed protein 30 n=1 Tax=Osmerus eperlanus TaxID=29151 RepID=UPI002E14BEF0